MTVTQDIGPVIEGDTLADTISVVDDGTPVDITDWTFTISIGEEVQKTVTDHEEPAEGVSRFEINSSETAQLSGEYRYDIEAITGLGDVATLMTGTIRFMTGVAEHDERVDNAYSSGDALEYLTVPADPSLDAIEEDSEFSLHFTFETTAPGADMWNHTTFLERRCTAEESGTSGITTWYSCVYLNGDGCMSFQSQGTGSVGDRSNPVNDGEEHSCVVTYTSDEVNMYIDGNNIVTAGGSDLVNVFTVPITICARRGNDGGAQNSIEAVVDDVIYWDRELTDDEVVEQSSGNLVADGVVCYYPFYEGIETADIAGDNDCTMNGGAWV